MTGPDASTTPDSAPKADRPAKPERLDVALVSRGLARSRTAAARAIEAGLVRIDGDPVVRAAVKVGPEQELSVDAIDRHVSRAALKLIAMLDHEEARGEPVRLAGRSALDVGASTGGFTQVLLERGAERVVALDVGHGQLHPLVRSDVRVVPVEGENARYLTAEGLARRIAETRRWPDADPRAIDLVVADLSFISLTQVIPAVRASVAAEAEWIVLVKPQFEVGRQGVRAGIVADRRLAADAVERVIWSAWDEGLGLEALIASPIAGTHGNREYVARLAPAEGIPGRHPQEWADRIRGLVEGRPQ